MSDKITWTNERRKLSQLIPWPRNPRQIKTDQAKRLVESFDQFGQVETIAIGPDNGVYNGHQRLNVLASKYGQDYEVEVRVASRPLDEKEREKLTIFLHKGAAGEWDFDTLANEFEIPDLIDWGFKPYELGIVNDPDNPNTHWGGMPEFENSEKAIKSLYVHFKSEADYRNFANLINQNLTPDTRSIWYPEVEKQDMKSLAFNHES